MLCNNDVDRDHEKFTRQALEKLGALFVGKTGIFDHSMKSGDQAARIYATAVVPVTRPPEVRSFPFSSFAPAT